MKVRNPHFDFSNTRAHWCTSPEQSQVINAGNIIPTYIEPFLIKVMRKAAKELDPVADAELIADMDIFNRQEAQNAPDSRVALPQSFTIVTPANHQQVTDGDTVVVSWMPTGAPAKVDLIYSADCAFPSGPHSFSSGTLSDDSNADGQESVSIDDIVNFVRSSSTATITRCSIDVSVRHQHTGSVDPAFDRGIALGIVSRKVNLDYIPR